MVNLGANSNVKPPSATSVATGFTCIASIDASDLSRRIANASIAKQVGPFVGLFLPPKSVCHVGKHRHRRSASLSEPTIDRD